MVSLVSLKIKPVLNEAQASVGIESRFDSAGAGAMDYHERSQAQHVSSAHGVAVEQSNAESTNTKSTKSSEETKRPENKNQRPRLQLVGDSGLQLVGASV